MTEVPFPAPLFHVTVPVHPVAVKVELLPDKIVAGFALAIMLQGGGQATGSGIVIELVVLSVLHFTV